MKTLAKTLKIALCLLAPLMIFSNNPSPSNIIIGSGKIKTKTIAINDFSKLLVYSEIEIVLSESKKKEIVFIGDDNIIELIQFEQESEKLTIKNKLNTFFKKSNKVIAYIPYTSLESILINGNSLVTSKNAIKSDYLKINVKNNGQLRLDVNIENSDILLDSNSTVTLNGNIETSYMEVAYNSKIEASSLCSKEVTVKLTGLCDVSLNCSDQLNAYVCGNGVLKYKGSPKKELDIKGTGKIIQLKN